MECVVVVPTYNERSGVKELLSCILPHSLQLSVITVDGNPPDGATSIVDANARRDGRVASGYSSVKERLRQLGYS